MDGDSWMQIILLVLLIMGASYFAASEISFASINRIRLKSYVDDCDSKALKAMYIVDNFDEALTTILIGNNITHIGFASLATLISTKVWGVGSVKYTTIASTIIVFLISEMLPKSYGKSNFKFALNVSGSLYILVKIFRPITILFTSFIRKIQTLFPIEEGPDINEEDFHEIMKLVEEEGILDDDKQELIHSALDFDVTTVGEVYKPIQKVVSLSTNSTTEEIIRKIKSTKHSRLPVYKNRKDNIVGVLQTRQYLKRYLKLDADKEEIKIVEIMLKPEKVNVYQSIDDVLRFMSSKKAHISIVVDENDKALGIVTAEDILEELVGEIWDEDDVIG